MAIDLSKYSLEKNLDKYKLPATQQPSILSNIQSDYQKRLGVGGNTPSNVENIADQYAAKKISAPSAVLQIAGQGAGALADTAFDVVKGITPQPVKDVIKSGIGAVTNLPGIKQAVQGVGSAYGQFKASNPEAAGNLEAVGNIATILPAGKIAGAGTEALGKGLVTAGKTLEESGVAGAKAIKDRFAQELVSPIRTAAVKADQVARTTETGTGILKRSIIEPTYAEAKAIKEVSQVPGVSPEKTIQQNYNIIRDYNQGLAKKLETDLTANDFIFPKKELKARLAAVEQKALENPVLVGDSLKSAQKLIGQFNKLIDSVPAKGSELLKARKQFDRIVEDFKGSKVFDPKTESAFSVVLRDIRRTANDFLDEKAPNAGVKDSLRKQSALYDALENITPKAAEEADTAIGRVFQKMGKVVGTKNKLVQQIATIVGIGGLGAAATFAPGVAATLGAGFVIQQAGRFVLNPQIRIALGKLLQLTGKQLSTADKAILKEYMEANEQKVKDYLKANPPSVGMAIKDINSMSPEERAAQGIKSPPMSPRDTDWNGPMNDPNAGNNPLYSKPPPVTSPKVQGATPKTTAPFQGFTDLSTKLLEKLKGRTTVSRQFIEDLTNSPDLKQPERDLFRSLLQEEGDQISVPDFANRVKSELLPLKASPSEGVRGMEPTAEARGSRYENITLPDELRGPVANYNERIYESPIKTSAGQTHFGGESDNYFAHTRVEDLPPESFKEGEFSPSPSTKGDTRRVIELQSDLFQKGRLEGEIQAEINAGITGSKKLNDLAKKADEARVKYGTENNPVQKEFEALLAREKGETVLETKRLEPYRNTWHERVIREEVKQAAKDGKTKLQFPTGETAMKIEGLGNAEQFHAVYPMAGENGRFAVREIVRDPSELKVGKELQGHGNNWIITEVLDNGKFKAVEKYYYDLKNPKNWTIKRDMSMGKPNWFIQNTATHDVKVLPIEADPKAYVKEQSDFDMSRHAEQFDISGKVDTENPIFKFYEKEVGKYLKNKYGATQITDPQGVKWWEVNIKPEYKKLPIEAFGLGAIPLVGAPTTKKK